MPRLTAVLAIAAFVWGSSAEYVLVDDYAPRTFFNNFNFFSGNDPTGGTVRYQTRKSAESLGLIATTEESAIIHVDHENISPSGRAAVRLEGKESFQKGLLVVDVKHMPGGICGVWPALWTLGSGTWPHHGEIDIIEGVNMQKRNLMTLHTDSGCYVNGGNQAEGSGPSFTPSFTGRLATANCDVEATGQSKNMGCQFEAPHGPSKLQARDEDDETDDDDSSDSSRVKYAPTYGPRFNKNGGGIFAMEWTSDGIQIFFFPHKDRKALHPKFQAAFAPTPNQTSLYADPNAAPAVYGKNALTLPATDDPRWGQPQAQFTGSGCDFDRHFQMHRVVLNTDFCGEWAGQDHIWQEGGCAAKTGSSTCRQYVINNPEAFEEAYWEIRSMRWYQWEGGDDESTANSEDVEKMEKREVELQGLEATMSKSKTADPNARTSDPGVVHAPPTTTSYNNNNIIRDFAEVETHGSYSKDDGDDDDDDCNCGDDCHCGGSDSHVVRITIMPADAVATTMPACSSCRRGGSGTTKTATKSHATGSRTHSASTPFDTEAPAAPEQLKRRSEAPMFEEGKSAGASLHVAVGAVVALAGVVGFVGAVL